MCLRSLTGVCVLVIVVCFLAIVAVPVLRRSLIEETGLGPAMVDLVAEAEQRPNDPGIWIAALAYAQPGSRGQDAVRPIYQKAVELSPRSAAPHFLFATGISEGAIGYREEINALNPPDLPKNSVIHEEPPTEEQLGRLGEARAALRKAAGLDPHNAAIYYLDALLAFAEHKDADAVSLLRRAMFEPKWETYGREVARGASSVSTITARRLSSGCVLSFITLARMVSGMAVIAERNGDHQRAILLRESGMRLGRRMLQQGYDMTEGVLGATVWTIVGLAPGDGDDFAHAVRRRAQYYRDHGRPDLAQEVESFGPKVYKWVADNREWRHALAHNLVAAAAHEAPLATVAALVTLLAVALLSGLLVAIKRSVQPIRYPRWAWALLVFACVGMAFLEGLLRAEYAWVFYMMGLPLSLFVVLVVVAVHRRSARPGGAVGFVGHYLGTALAVLLPVCALLSLATLGLTVHTARESATYAKVIERGEMDYYGLRVR